MRMTVTHLTADYLRQILHYNPHTGIFTWRVDKANQKAGDIAGGVCGSDHTYIRIDGVRYIASRLAYLYTHGHPVPLGLEIGHHNHIQSDNRWINLYAATRAEILARCHKRIRDAKASAEAAKRRKSLPHWNLNALQSGDPLDGMLKVISDNMHAIEIAQLIAERDRRKGGKRNRSCD